jgi:hypothetical protein
VASGANTGKVKQLVAGTNITLTETDTDHVSIAAASGVTSISAANSTIIATPDPITATGTMAVNPNLSLTSISATTGTFTNINLTNYDGVVKSVGTTSAPNYSLVVASGANTGKVKQLVAGTNITLTETDTDHVSIASGGITGILPFSVDYTAYSTIVTSGGTWQFPQISPYTPKLLLSAALTGTETCEFTYNIVGCAAGSRTLVFNIYSSSPSLKVSLNGVDLLDTGLGYPLGMYRESCTITSGTNVVKFLFTSNASTPSWEFLTSSFSIV